MSTPLTMMITQAGLFALVNAADPIVVTQVGLTQAAFVAAPTIDTLPGEFKRLSTVSGAAVSDTMIHMTAVDSTTDIYDLRGFGLYLDDGTLFAIYSQPTPVFRKVSVASFLLALDIAFGNGTGDISFGDATFLWPPATETVIGVARIAINAEADAGTNDQTIITPKKLKRRLDALAQALGGDLDSLAAMIAALVGRTIGGTGLVTGGGDLSASRTLTVAAATAADAAAGVAANIAVTPAAFLGGLELLGGWNGSVPIFRIPGTPIIVQIGEHRATSTVEGPVSMTFAQAFPNACLWVGPISYISANDNLRDMFVQMRERSPTGFTVYYQQPDASDNRIDGFDWLAVGY